MFIDPEITVAQIGPLEVSPKVSAAVREGYQARVRLYERADELKPDALQTHDQELIAQTRREVMAQVESDLAQDDGHFDTLKGQILTSPRVSYPDAEARTSAERRNAQALQSAHALAAEVAVARDLETLTQRIKDALLMPTPDATRLVASATIARLDALAAHEKGDARPATYAADRARLVFATWRRDHPTDSERLDAIEQDRRGNRFTKTRDADTVLRAFGYGSTRPMPGAIEMGPAWERGPRRPYMPPVGDPRRTPVKKAGGRF